jgi:uncharacterized protein
MPITFQNPVKTVPELREIMGYPNEVVTRKTIDHLDQHCLDFIKNSPFITIATSDSDGRLDVSPKGDPAGFVKALDSCTLAIPDRPGNKKADTLTNIIQNPRIGLIFLIPGIKETLRINGSAQVVRDQIVLDLLVCNGKTPEFAIIVHVEEAFMHCAKCMVRSALWSNQAESKNRPVPTLGKILVDHAQLDIPSTELDERIRQDEKTNLY